MFDIGGGELLLILIAVLVFFGPKKLPELARSVGRGMREFKRAQREFTDQINTAFSEEEGRQRGNIARRPIPRVEPPRVDFHGEEGVETMKHESTSIHEPLRDQSAVVDVEGFGTGPGNATTTTSMSPPEGVTDNLPDTLPASEPAPEPSTEPPAPEDRSEESRKQHDTLPQTPLPPRGSGRRARDNREV